MFARDAARELRVRRQRLPQLRVGCHFDKQNGDSSCGASVPAVPAHCRWTRNPAPVTAAAGTQIAAVRYDGLAGTGTGKGGYRYGGGVHRYGGSAA